MKFLIITAAYDCPNQIAECLRSIAAQKLDGFDMNVCVVSDAPPGGEWQNHFIRDFCSAHGWQSIINEQRRGALFNQVAAIGLLDGGPDDVLVFVDGDDRLASSGVLLKLARAYENPELLLTYGSYMPDPPSLTCTGPHPIPQEAWGWQRGFRGWAADHHNMCFNHLRTFRVKLFSEMTSRDWTWPSGEWFMCAGDAAMMIPAIELAGEGRILMFREPLLIYTSDHPSADWRLRSNELEAVHQYILRQLPPKARLP